LLVAPCLPPEWKGFRMKRRFRGADYEILVTVGGRKRQARVDGRAWSSDTLPVFGDGRLHKVWVRVPAATAEEKE
jgi:cellobiose phosphorylase